jgi:hypothetical protein
VTVEERISNMLVKWLLEEKDILAAEAIFYGTNSGLDDGCDTCGYGSTEMSFDIRYKPVGSKTYEWLNLSGDPLDMLPVLLKYDV